MYSEKYTLPAIHRNRLLRTRHLSLEHLECPALLPALRLVRDKRIRERDHVPLTRLFRRHMLLPVWTLVVKTSTSSAVSALSTTRLSDLVCTVVDLEDNDTAPTKHSEHVTPPYSAKDTPRMTSSRHAPATDHKIVAAISRYESKRLEINIMDHLVEKNTRINHIVN